MQHTVAVEIGRSTDRRVEAFRLAGTTGPAGIAPFLPSPSDDDYLFTLSELVRADVQQHAARGIPRPLTEYRRAFPALDAALIARKPASVVETPPPVGYGTVCNDDAPAADRFPMPGDDLEGYDIQEELGRGASGRVYLATERRLSSRQVVLKLSDPAVRRVEALARLQHTNIVPIQTAFRVGLKYAVQMPYFGRQTLADLIDHVRERTGLAHASGRVFETTVARASTSVRSNPNPSITPLPFKLPPVLVPAITSATRRMLATLAYPDAVVWVVSRLADGLAHAHAAGLLHLDLKPANVLVSDDGQPMLLDFNLASEAADRHPYKVGGTWPYMAPEQMLAFARQPGGEVSEQSDLFALGVIFYELLTARLPFPPFAGGPDGLAEAVAVRRLTPPDVRAINPAVSPAIAAVVRKLLAPEPADRYPSAAAVKADLDLHMAHRPLAFAGNPSLTERVAKWKRRHPVLLTRLIVGWLVAAVAGLSVAVVDHESRARRSDDARQAAAFLAAEADLRADLTSVTDSAQRSAGLSRGETWLAADVPTHRLPAETASSVATARGELIRLMAHAAARNGDARADRLAELAATAPAPSETGNMFLTAAAQMADGRFDVAIPLLTDLTDRERDHFAGHFALGYCLHKSGQTSRAMERYLMAQAARPTDPRPAYNRGLILLERRQPALAEAEFKAALARDPTAAEVYWAREIARRAQDNLKGAITDLTRGMAFGLGEYKTRALRKSYSKRLGDDAAVAADEAALAALTPVSAQDFTVRGIASIESDPAAALVDFRRATALEPAYMPAWANTARVLADKLDRLDEAIVARQRAVELAPAQGPVRGGLAILLARAGRRAEAHTEISWALADADDAVTTMSAAFTYAVTSKESADDRALALEYFRAGLRQGYNANALDDVDMAAVRDLPEFQEAARLARKRVH